MGGQNREGSKRQGDNWGTPWHEEYQVYFISSKGRSSAHAGGVKKRDVLISLRSQASPRPAGLCRWAREQCPASHRLGHREPHSPGPSATPCLPHCSAGCAVGLPARQEPPHGPRSWHGLHSLCFAWGQGLEVSEGGLSALAGPRGPPKYIIE